MTKNESISAKYIKHLRTTSRRSNHIKEIKEVASFLSLTLALFAVLYIGLLTQ